MDEETLKRIFTPLFTTKAKGTGLGLAVCKRLAERLGGRIEVKSSKGAGTTFTLVLPASGSPERQKYPSRARVRGALHA